MPLDPDLLSILACPIDKGPLIYIESDSILYNPRLRRSYRVQDDTPVLIAEQGVTVSEDEHARLLRVVAVG